MSAAPPAAAKRFYKEAAVFEDAQGFGVALDGNALKTPGGSDFRAPTRALAHACADEWSLQSEYILPAAMPVTQLSFAAIDHTPRRREDLITHVSQYAETDLCCHRVQTPVALAERQAAAWDPFVDRAADELGARPPLVVGVIQPAIDPDFVGAIAHAAAGLDDFRLTALAQGTDLTGSALIGFAFARAQIDAAHAFAAATIDEHWSFENWGEDAEARARLERLHGELVALGRFIGALGA